MSEIQLPDWVKIENAVLEMATRAITKFAELHSDEQLIACVFCIVPYYGWLDNVGLFDICFETVENNLRVMQEYEQELQADRTRYLNYPDGWDGSVTAYLDNAGLSLLGPEKGFFKYDSFDEVLFTDWPDYADFDNLPETKGSGWNYMGGNSKIVVWRVIEKLISADIFKKLNLTFPFYIGYQLFEQPIIIVRILR